MQIIWARTFPFPNTTSDFDLPFGSERCDPSPPPGLPILPTTPDILNRFFPSDRHVIRVKIDQVQTIFRARVCTKSLLDKKRLCETSNSGLMNPITIPQVRVLRHKETLKPNGGEDFDVTGETLSS